MPNPIVFVHGNGDSAALWHTTLWRFESNGYPRERLFAIDFSYPTARDDDGRPQQGRSGTADQLRELAAFVDAVRRQTGAAKIALVASSRGANAVRNYVRNGGGAPLVSHAVLAGGVNHGVYALADFNSGSEFNGRGPFMTGLNAPYPGGTEVAPGVRWLTLRSDGGDKYAQPEGGFIGQPGMDTNMSASGPELRGAENVILPGTDHREVAFGPAAFVAMYRFITGQPPLRTGILAEATVILDGKLSGYCNGAPTNLPLAGATLTIYQVDATTAARLPRVPHVRIVGNDGRWGPCPVDPSTWLEFVVEAPGHPVTHIYRSPFPRSSEVIHLRPAMPQAKTGEESGAGVGIVAVTRPRGYFGAGRDLVLIDGKVPAGITTGVPSVSEVRMRVRLPPRPVAARFNDERITVVNWPASEGRLVFAEFHD